MKKLFIAIVLASMSSAAFADVYDDSRTIVVENKQKPVKIKPCKFPLSKNKGRCYLEPPMSIPDQAYAYAGKINTAEVGGPRAMTRWRGGSMRSGGNDTARQIINDADLYNYFTQVRQ